MSHDMIVVGPGNKHRVPEFATEVARLQEEVSAIEACGDDQACRVCGAHVDLTEEHTPAKAAGNLHRLMEGNIDYPRSAETGEIVWKTELIQGGARTIALCGICNPSTGRWYNPAYVRFVKHCREFAVPDNAGKECEVRLTVHRQRVAKQALTTLVATSQPGITGYYPHLRRLLCHAEACGSLAPLRLWLFLRANSGSRSTGITTTVNLESRRGFHRAEFSFWPLGWILALDNTDVPGALDVSKWTEFGYHDKTELLINVPCQWAIWPYPPADFRPPEAFTDSLPPF